MKDLLSIVQYYEKHLPLGLDAQIEDIPTKKVVSAKKGKANVTQRASAILGKLLIRKASTKEKNTTSRKRFTKQYT